MNLKSRKLIFATVVFLLATLALFTGKADFAGWSELAMWIFGIYSFGNVGEHLTKQINPKK
jgi:hypothetical protein